MRFLFQIFVVLALMTSAAQAQSTSCKDYPYCGVTTTNKSGTITTGISGAFQEIMPASTATQGRSGCTVQNTGTNAMYVFFGPIANATTGKAVKILAGQSVSCGGGGIVLRDQVSISGTSGEAFYAAQQ